MAVRSHKVHTEDGRVYRRNCSHLYKVPEKYQPISDVKAVKSERTSRNPIPSYVIQRTRSVSRYFSYIFMCCFSMVKFSKKLHSTYPLYFVSSNEMILHFLALWKMIKTIFLGRYSFLRKKTTNKQTKQKQKQKQNNNKKTFKFSPNLELRRKPIIFREHDLMLHIPWWLSQSKHCNCNIQWFSF